MEDYIEQIEKLPRNIFLRTRKSRKEREFPWYAVKKLCSVWIYSKQRRPERRRGRRPKGKPRGKSCFNAFALAERINHMVHNTTGRCHGLSADLAPSGRKPSFRSFRAFRVHVKIYAFRH